MNTQLGSQIFYLLNEINRSPDFHVSQSSKAFFPQLLVDGLGELALPLCDAQAKQLIKLCSKAPYGKGTETIVDDNVRKVWELDGTKIGMGNHAWKNFITKTLRNSEEQLDLQGQTLIAHPYKLLLYEEGSFFLAHQDTEKEDGMVATLVVSLPSTHQGGELTLTHRDKSVCIDFSSNERRYDFQSVLFYTDCYHEVSPVKEGYRLVLTYNICIKGQRKLSTFDFTKQQQTVSRLFKNWKNKLNNNDEKHLIISLDHQYSASGFSLDTLKGVDRSRADVLLHSAQQAGCKAYICLLEKYELFQAWDEDDIDELIEDYLVISQLIDSTGKKVDIQISQIQENDILRQHDLEDEEAFEEDYEGYMGNYGNTLSRWYRHAAVILWPEEYQLNILARNDVSAAIAYLQHLHSTKEASFGKDLHSLLSMVDNKLCLPRDEHFTLLTLTLSQNDVQLAKLYCHYFLLTQDKLPPTKETQQVIALCGWTYLKKTLDLKEAGIRLRLFEILNMIKTSLHWVKHPALEELFYKAIAESSKNSGWNSDANKNFKLIFTLCLELTTTKSVDELVNFLGKQSQHLAAESDILPYLEKQLSRDAKSTNTAAFSAATNWLDKQFHNYRQRIKHKPEPALVETMPTITNCRCGDCEEILSFMHSHAESRELGRLKAQCEHLASQIRLHRVQLVGSINKRRRPWRFTMRKLGADQREKIAEYKIALGFIQRLDKLRE